MIRCCRCQDGNILQIPRWEDVTDTKMGRCYRCKDMGSTVDVKILYKGSDPLITIFSSTYFNSHGLSLLQTEQIISYCSRKHTSTNVT